MDRHKMISMVIVLLFLSSVISSCKDSGGGDNTTTITYSISGRVTSGGNGLQGVTVSLVSSSGTQTITTSSSGNYNFTGLANGTYTVTPTMNGYTCSPLNQSVTISGSNVTTVDFTASSQTLISLKTSTLRTLQPGDIWTYGNVSGTLVEGLSTTPSATINFTGTFISSITSSVMTSPTPSIACKVQDDHAILSAGSSTLVDAHDFTYFTQDSTGVYKYGDYSQSIHWITTPPYNRLEMSSPVSLGTTTSSSVTYSDGVMETRSYTVAAKEYVSIGNIDYESYKIVSTITTTYNGATYESSTKNITSWLVPGLGYVKQHQTEYDYKTGHALDAIVDFTATLTFTNVQY